MSKTVAELHKEIDKRVSLEFSGFMHETTVEDVLLMFREEKQAIISSGTFNLDDDMDKRVLQVARIMFNKLTNEEKFHYQKVARQMKSHDSESVNEAPLETIVMEKMNWKEVERYNKMKESKGIICSCDTGNESATFSTAELYTEHMEQHSMDVLYGCHNCNYCFLSVEAHHNHTCEGRRNAMKTKYPADREFKIAIMMLACRDCGFSMNLHPSVTGEQAIKQMEAIRSLYLNHSCTHLGLIKILTTDSVLRAEHKWKVDFILPNTSFHTRKRKCCGKKFKADVQYKKHMYEHLTKKEKLAAFLQSIHQKSTKNILRKEEEHGLADENDVLRNDKLHTRISEKFPTRSTQLVVTLDDDDELENYELVDLASSIVASQSSSDEYKVTVEFSSFRETVKPYVSALFERVLLCTKCRYACVGDDAALSHYRECYPEVGEIPEDIVEDSNIFETLVEDNSLPNVRVLCKESSCTTKCCSLDGYKAHMVIAHSIKIKIFGDVSRFSTMVWPFFDWKTRISMDINEMCGLTRDGTLPCPISDTYRPGSQYKAGSFAREKPRKKRRGNRYRYSPDGMLEDDTPYLESVAVSANSSEIKENEQMQEGLDDLDKEPLQIPEEVTTESAELLEQQYLLSPRTRLTEVDGDNTNTTCGDTPVDSVAETERQAMTVAQLWDEGRKSRDTPPEESEKCIHFGNFCFHCGFHLQSEEALMKHIEAHEIRYVSCRLCEEEYSFPDTGSYMKHLCYHHGRTAENNGETFYQCSFCERTFSQYLLVPHLIFDCYNSPRCGICGENMHGMRSNQRKSHSKKHREFWKRFLCGCQETFPNYQLYKNHVCASKESRTLVVDMEPQLFIGVVVDRAMDPVLFQTCQKLPANVAETDRSNISLESSADRTQTISNDTVTSAAVDVDEARRDERLQEKESTSSAFEGTKFSNDMTETTYDPSCSSSNVGVSEDVCPPSVMIDTCPPSVMIISSTNVSPSHSTHDDAFCQPSTSSMEENYSLSRSIPPSTVTIRPDDNEIEIVAGGGSHQSGVDRHNDSDIIFEEPSRTGDVVAWGVEDDDLQVAEVPSGTTAGNSGREKSHKCKLCSHAFYTKRNLDAHEKEKHSSDIARFGENLCDEDYGIPRNEVLHLCVLCSFVFDSRERFEIHYHNHMQANNPILQCEYCCGIQLSTENMNQHKKYHGYEIGTQRQVKAPTLRYICVHCDPHYIFVEESGLLLHLMQNHGKEILFYCKGCFFASCNVELVKTHFFEGCRPISNWQSGWGFALANQVNLQPLNKDVHERNLSSRPGDYVVMSNCSHRTFIRFGLKFTSCPEEKTCHGIVNYSRYENLLKARLNFFEDEIPQHLLPSSVYIRPNYNLENWINFKRGPITNEDKSPTEWPWPYNLPQHTAQPAQQRTQPQQANMFPPQQHSVAGQRSAAFHSTPVRQGVFPQQIPAGHVQGRMFVTPTPSTGQLPVFTQPVHPYSMTGQGMQRQPMMASAAMMPGAPVVMQPLRQPRRHLVSCAICETVMLSSFILHLPQDQREKEAVIAKICSVLPANRHDGIKMKMSYPGACICWRHVNPYGIILQTGERLSFHATEITLDYVQFARQYEVLANAEIFSNALNEIMTNACNEYFIPNDAVDMLRRANTCGYPYCVSKALTSNMNVRLHRAHSSQNFHIMCQFCNAFFDTVPALFGHIYSQHYPGAIGGHQLRYSLKCPLCNSPPFDEPRRFRFHIKNDHKSIFQQLTINCDTHFATEEARIQHDRKHRNPSPCCFICGLATPPKFTPPGTNLHLPHEAIHALIPSYICRICLHEFVSESGIVKHFVEGHGLQGSCESQMITRYRLGVPSNNSIVVVVNNEELCRHLGI